VSAVARMLPDGRRLHLHHGPIDMIVEAWGPPEAVAGAYRAAAGRFEGLLEELVAELPALRSPDPGSLRGPVARAMAAAVAPFRPAFVTPMAAVAGADADAVLAAMVASGGLVRAYVNNGGDIALHLAPGRKSDSRHRGAGRAAGPRGDLCRQARCGASPPRAGGAELVAGSPTP
jgi:uncharacterized protein